MPAPLPNDLRNQIVEAYERGEGSLRELAARFQVGLSSVYRYLSLKRSKGSIAPAVYQPGPDPKIDEAGLELLRSLLAEAPHRTDRELAVVYAQRTGVAVGHSTINRAIHRLGLRRKRGRPAAHLAFLEEHRRAS